MSVTRDPRAVAVVRELSPFGVEIDLDLSVDLDDSTSEQIRELFDRHHLLLFRNQTLSAAQQAQLLSIVGPVIAGEMEGATDYVSTEPTIGSLGRTQLAFHSDMACAPNPLIALALFAEDVTGPTSTLFADNVAAAATLSDELRARVSGRSAAHYWPKDIADGMQARSDEVHEGWPGSVHPVVMPHPRTGVPVLYITKVQTHHIVDMDPAESRALIDELERHTYDRTNVYEHHWRNGDVVFWD
ncbi:MAG: TauD/TfdA dioxygenase family protein, partial [Acidimicrobiia bacterium]